MPQSPAQMQILKKEATASASTGGGDVVSRPVETIAELRDRTWRREPAIRVPAIDRLHEPERGHLDEVVNLLRRTPVLQGQSEALGLPAARYAGLLERGRRDLSGL